jgi:hypothetical protein
MRRIRNKDNGIGDPFIAMIRLLNVRGFSTRNKQNEPTTRTKSKRFDSMFLLNIDIRFYMIKVIR